MLKICLDERPDITRLILRASAPSVEALDDLVPKLRKEHGLCTVDLSECGLQRRSLLAVMPLFDQVGDQK
jgi:hypothetical protein